MNKASVLLAAGVALLLSSHQTDAFMAPAAMSLRAPSRMPVRPSLDAPTPKRVLIHGGSHPESAEIGGQQLMQPPMSDGTAFGCGDCTESPYRWLVGGKS